MISLLIIFGSMIPFFLMFERRRPHAREVMLIAVLVTIAVMSRTVFFMLPFFKPMLAVVIISGIGLGSQCGLLVGTLSAFVSNFIFGQGPWTIWQMLAMGICGAIAGLIFSGKDTQKKIVRISVCIYGIFVAVFVYGLIMDTYSALLYTGSINAGLFLTIYLSGLPVNLVHAFSTCLFLALLTNNIVRKLRRIKIKYNF